MKNATCLLLALLICAALNAQGNEGRETLPQNSRFDIDFDKALASGQNVILDTITDFFLRGDRRNHVITFTNIMDPYQRWVVGTRSEYSDIGMHFDYPTPSEKDAEVSSLEVLGFQVRVGINQVQGSADVFTYSLHNADLNGMPEGEALASGEINSGSLEGRLVDISFNDGSGVQVKSEEGYVISFATNHAPNDDILIIANNNCGTQDGKGENRLKVKLISDGNWRNLRQVPLPNFGNFDCDAYIFPIIRITEETGDVTSVDEGDPTGLDVDFFPNPSADHLNLDIRNPRAEHLRLAITDMQGNLMIETALGADVKVLKQIDTRVFASGIYNVFVRGQTMNISQRVVITR